MPHVPSGSGCRNVVNNISSVVVCTGCITSEGSMIDVVVGGDGDGGGDEDMLVNAGEPVY